ncbi:class F sortase [Kutzneria viridogrisea]|uniref:Peptidase C60 sortase A and B n=2 Tax=Kutzneria TaxID=43356 RepID=W5WRX8_9PSEU|nr:class F sortase [Kutzneria albida]AHI00925.1 hypothetical protein KALB_7567 [Kutzneria albida DSM 43870]MBA8926202.1 hypothetical protein [Kutzneria viridogrisea]
MMHPVAHLRRPRRPVNPGESKRGNALGIAALITAFALAGVVIGILRSGGVGMTSALGLSDNGIAFQLPPPAPGTTTPTAPADPTVPVRVDIDGVDAHSSLIPLGLNGDRTVQVPPIEQPLQAGWYRFGVRPGDLGRAVVLGHVDGNGQPGIFARLAALRPGDTARITRQDGSVLRFTVQQVQQIPKTSFPTQQVYGPSAQRELKLITCGGRFDPATRRFADNVIVSAVLTS